MVPEGAALKNEVITTFCLCRYVPYLIHFTCKCHGQHCWFYSNVMIIPVAWSSEKNVTYHVKLTDTIRNLNQHKPL